jgi:hypothetical protein
MKAFATLLKESKGRSMLDDDIKILLRELKLEKYVDELERFSQKPQEKPAKVTQEDEDLVAIKVRKVEKKADLKKPLFFLTLIVALGVTYMNYPRQESMPSPCQEVAARAVIEGPEGEVRSLLAERRQALDKIREQISSLISQHGECKMSDFSSALAPFIQQIGTIDEEYTAKVTLAIEEAKKKQEGEKGGEESALSALAASNGFSS